MDDEIERVTLTAPMTNKKDPEYVHLLIQNLARHTINTYLDYTYDQVKFSIAGELRKKRVRFSYEEITKCMDEVYEIWDL